jgi:hypothetical protein
MSMQIKSIVLYNHSGETRAINFRLGQVNIITGKSSTGKSAMIDIVEYCLGRSDFRVPDGLIRDTVAWYSVLYQIDETQVFVAKPPPPPGNSSQSQVYIEAGAHVDIPPFDKLIPNSTDEAVIGNLSQRLGISPNLNIPEEGESRRPLEATLKHARFYLFQKQTVVANEDVLFHRQSEPYMPQAIKDTLPYFLGVVQEDRLKLIQDLREARRALKRAERNLEEAELVAGEGLRQGQALLAEAQQVGLIDAGSVSRADENVLETLRHTLSWHPARLPPDNSDVIPTLEREIQGLRDEFRRKQEQACAADTYAQEAQGYSTEAAEQELRLESVGLFEEASDHTEKCPLCSHTLSEPPASATVINGRLRELRKDLTIVNRERPRLREYIQALEAERESLRQRISDREAALAGVLQEHHSAAEVRDTNTRIAKVVGRISLYLETVALTDERSSLRETAAQARRKVEYYESLLDPAEMEDRQASILSSISAQMTEWAKRLHLEYTGYPYRLDLNRLTVVADRAGHPIPMGQGMGGGDNWLGCHLIAYLGLHKYFIEQGRPVPNFLILDQPTQVYFPRDVYDRMDGTIEDLTDDDRVAVNRVFDFLFDVCEQLAPGLQIIVLDHANLPTERFREALVEPPWHGGTALIPEEWFADH